MKPVKTTIEGEQEEQRKAVCDEIIHRAASMMVDEVGASIPMMLDRVFTFATAQAYIIQGKEGAAAILREMASNIDKGALDFLKLDEGSAKH
ncbi:MULTISPECIES: hypothetical protein [Brucella]|uniref:Uncharacterized protein n=1 Tax=Brucella lupini TaxID=255457 RepID=A0A256GIQ1_9HYPH|nr:MULTISPECIES: hypothetical protein [Brucella]KAB2705055.1 hypothetical protein F9L03_06605 [Brucella lupini]KAB2736059.1 hypothetical protein F9K89_15890 [Brucella anthropi]OYR26898.1 hypothetical protein CES86_3250 [Brucella lupini]